MKPRLLVTLLLCATLLTACYRQTEESFQQADSAEVVVAATPTSIEAVVEDGTVSADEGAGSFPETPQYVTPETVPGQVEQPTVESPTAIPITATPLAETLTPFVRPTETVAFAEELDPDHECVYTVRAGDNLFRLSLNWNTTVQEIMDASQVDSDALSIGQLLLRPGCEYSPPTARPTVLPAPALVETETPEATTEEGAEVAVEPVDTATPSQPRIHVVSSGDTVESISLRYRVDVNQLVALNSLTNPNRLTIGQELLLPD
ncbi:MAG: LysM peptidoglycan-binding domain-containing protein [Chloroflexi bacterium]|nr:LysM peptidoglycan-binding domain-containing protein [Chloroflexota bacterium]